MCSELIEMGEPIAGVSSTTSFGVIADGSYVAFGSEGTVKVSFSEAIGFFDVSMTEAIFSDAAPPCSLSARIEVMR